jgi:hypothetical protein
MSSVKFNMRRSAAGALAGAILLALALPGSALAHERRTIANGKYDVVVGWNVEPAFVGQMNGSTIRIMNAGTTTPVTGADKTLKLDVRQGASTQSFPLTPVFGQEGLYIANLMPTRAGDYRFVFTGSINGDQVNETFDSADGKFNGVEAPTAVQFPVQLGDPAQNVAAVQAAQSDAQSARTLAIAGIVIGVLGLLVGIGAWLMRPKAATVTAPGQERVTERV